MRLEVVPLGLAGRRAGARPAPSSATAGRCRCCSTTVARAPAASRRCSPAARFDVVHAQLVRTARVSARTRRAAGGPRPDRRAVREPRSAGGARARPARRRWSALEARRLARCERGAGGARRARRWWCRRPSGTPSAAASRVVVVPNGVDVDGVRVPGRAAGRRRRCSSSATSGYFPNVDAARLARATRSFRACGRRVPAATLRLVGARPARAVRALAGLPGVLAGGRRAGRWPARSRPPTVGGRADAGRERAAEQGARGDGGRARRW